MDQVKVFLRQCVKHRFWIAVGISALLPMIGYLIGSGPINEATAKAETEIKGADGEVKKFTTPGLPNDQYVPIVKAKTEVLSKDVQATWQKLFEQQEPLLRWPESVEPEFRRWGRKWPQDVDRGQVQKTIIDYTIEYPNFVSKVYRTFKPWNPEDGTGIVAAPDEKLLMTPAPFTPETPPLLGAVWAEQERLWVLTALLDGQDELRKDNAALEQEKVHLWETMQRIAQYSYVAEHLDASALAGGVTLTAVPELAQVEQLRATVVQKNRLYFYRWRPQNETYLFGFRKHEQGRNAAEIVQFDPLIAEQEAAMAALAAEDGDSPEVSV